MDERLAQNAARLRQFFTNCSQFVLPGSFGGSRMYVVERRIDETVIVGDLLVRVIEIEGRRVRLAISSPQGPRYQEFECDLDSGLASRSVDEPAAVSPN